MFFKLREGVLKKIIGEAFKKAGNIRKLEKIIGIPRSSLSGYHTEKRIINENNLKKIEDFLEIKIKEEDIINKLQDNWRQIKGGKNCVITKKENGTYYNNLLNAQRSGAKKLRKWHEDMKKNNPREYYLIQYSKFKKIGGYKFKTEKGEKVRNNFEKQIADILTNLKVDYEYEPLINIKNKYFFPDFLINNKIILECTAWRGEAKAYKLKEKIKYLKNKYRVYVVIPKNLYSYYKILDNHLIKGLDEFVPVAQTFLSKTS